MRIKIYVGEKASMANVSAALVVYREKFVGYRAGSDGTVWSKWISAGRVLGKTPTGPWRLLKEQRDRYGYRVVALSVNGRYLHWKVGRYILEAFVGPKPEGQLTRHLNDIRDDDRLDNLAYGTYADNAEDARRNGCLCIGEKHGNAILNSQLVRRIRQLKIDGRTYSEITKLTGVKKSLASHVVTRRLWGHVT